MKIAIVNRTNLKNYGSLLQTFALCEAVQKLGHDAEIIWERGTLLPNYDFRPKKLISTAFKLLLNPKLIKSTFCSVKSAQQHAVSDASIALFDEFIKSHVRRRYFSPIEIADGRVGRKYDKFICGSDQVWSSTTLYVDPLMYLRFAPKEKRIAYAPSIGRDYIPDYNKHQIRRFINDIPSISCREESGAKLIEELTGRNVPVVVDPVLLHNCDYWRGLEVKKKTEKKYVLCYFLDTPCEQVQKNIVHYAKSKNLDVLALNSRLEHVEKNINVTYPDCGPAEFLGFIDLSESTIVDSYHGMLFSIIFKKDFLSIEREYGEFDQSSRQMTVLKLLKLEDRYIHKYDDFVSEEIDYSLVTPILECEINKSVDYLKKAIEV